ncbi:TetR/AcrR family transcriptional regulator [uncultured Rhodoferax sp.]|uniref:TetR/AcrR family transcriptional regulator n=1 Tax=uncultured Rhodoferax sp. TaxID=223188 RepID=UPI0025F81827|nr:TetR/AcrR family transcriptional regulator [uncultured Rhodoferax sp.]
MVEPTTDRLNTSPTTAGAKGPANRQKIVEAALHLFMERGYAETSLGDVADLAGMLKGNLSYYFKTKADMLESVADARMQELFGRLQDRLPPQPSPQEALFAFIQVTEDSAQELARVGCPVGTLASQLGKTDPALQPHASRILEALMDWLTLQFGRVMPHAKAAAHAETLLTMLQGAAVMAHAFRDPGLVRRQAASARAWVESVTGA